MGRLSLCRLFLFEQCYHLAQIIDDRLEFRDGFGGEVLRLGQVFGVFEGFIVEPRDVELVISTFDLADVKFAKAPCFAKVFARASDVRIFAVASLELGEVLGRQRPFLLCDPGHVRARVEDPDILGRKSLLQEDDVCLHALAVRRESRGLCAPIPW